MSIHLNLHLDVADRTQPIILKDDPNVCSDGERQMSKNTNETNPTASSLQGTRRQFLSITTAAGAALFATSATAFATSEVSMMDLLPASSAIAPLKINMPNAAIDD